MRNDGDEPYLVVAADKGNRSFSDIANAISAEKNHWLGDAFASGGSQGYDHKKMGITARGAWEVARMESNILPILSLETIGVPFPFLVLPYTSKTK